MSLFRSSLIALPLALLAPPVSARGDSPAPPQDSPPADAPRAPSADNTGDDADNTGDDTASPEEVPPPDAERTDQTSADSPAPLASEGPGPGWPRSVHEKPRQAKTLSRGAAISMALTQNPQVAATRATVAQAKARREQVSSARFPSVSLTLGVGPSLQAELVPNTALQSTRNAYGDVRLSDLSLFFGGQLSVIQPLYTFGKLDERDAATEHEIKARQSQTRMTQADVAFSVADLYETLLYARDAQLFLEEMMHGLKRSLDSAESEVATGSMPEQDLLRLQTAMGYLDLAYHQASAGVLQANAGLVAYLGLPEGTEIVPAMDHLELIESKRLNEQQAIDLALRHRPELHALREGQAAFNSLAEAEDAGSLPDFFAAAFVSGAYTPGRDWVDTRFAVDPLNHFVPGGLLGMRWQFQGAMAGDRAAENRAKALEMAQLEQWARVGLPAEVKVALEDLRRSHADVGSTQLATDRAKKWMIQASADFSIGLGDSKEVEDASATYVQLRLANFRAKMEYNIALASLSKATGLLTNPSGGLYPVKD